MKFSRLAAIFLTVLSVTSVASAQTAPSIENGFKSFGSYHGGEFDTVNLQSGNLMLHVPMFSYTQRGGNLNVRYVLMGSSKEWAVGLWTDSHHVPHAKWMLQPGGMGIGAVSPDVFELHRSRHLTTDFVGNQTYTIDDYALVTGDGSWHWLSGQTPSGHMITMDGSGIQAVVTPGIQADHSDDTAVVITRDGTRYALSSISVPMPPMGQGSNLSGLFFPPELVMDAWGTTQTAYDVGRTLDNITDRNGNIIGLSTGLDTLGGHSFGVPGLSTSDYSGCVTTRQITGANIYSFPGPDGRTSSLKACMTQFVPTAAFSQPNVAPPSRASNLYELDSFADGYSSFIGSLVMPDGNRWSFDYDDFGHVTHVTLPTGGTITYVWMEIPDTCNDGSNTRVSRAVSSRTVDDNNGHSYAWHYTWGALAQDGSITNYVLDPNGNESAHVFHSVTNRPCDFYEVQTRSYQGTHSNGTLLKTVDTHYLGVVGNSASATFGVGVPDIITTSLPGNRVSKAVRQYDSGNPSVTTYGKVINEKVYDYGNGAPGPLLRETVTSYQWQANSAYLDAGFLDLPASVVVKDGAGCSLSETDYTYDESDYLTSYPGTLPAGTHGAAPAGAIRGNLTTVTRWLAPTTACNPKSGTAISTHTKWYDTGVPYQTVDPLGHTTTLSYDSAYAGAYPTQTCSPQTGSVAHCVSGTYDFSTGLLKSFSNENATTQASGNTPGDSAHTSSYSYDTSWRLTTAQAPPDPANNNAHATTSFTPSVPNAFPLSVQQQHSVTTDLIDSSTAYFDGLARVNQTTHALPEGTATVLTSYDGVSQPLSVTNPYFSTADSTYGVTFSEYDALGRTTQVTRQDGSITRQSYDELPAAGNGVCTRSTDEAGKQRRACTDALGRLVEIDEPNPAAAPVSAVGTLTINGTLQSHTFSGSAAVQARGTISMWSADPSGSDLHVDDPSEPCPPLPQTCPQIYDRGWVRATINGFSAQVSYGQFDTSSSVASNLAGAINSSGANAYVTANALNGTISIQAKNAGAAGNSITLSVDSASNDPADFGGGAFGGSTSGSTLSGGADAVNPVTVYDQGTVTLTVGSFTASTSYSQSGNSTAAQIATVLVGTGPSGLNRAGSPVHAIANGADITLTYGTAGAAGNAIVAAASSQSTQTQWTFSPPSFTSAGTTLAGGLNTGDVDNNPLITLYQYDGLSNLLCVEQHGGVTGTGCSADPSNDVTSPWRVRRFAYDSLGRLLTARNPESGTISYSYDADGNLLQKTSPAPNQTGTATQTISYCYDELHRVTGKAYGAQSCPLASPQVSYTYDSGVNAKGHLTGVTDQAGSASYSYDVLGRLSSETRVIAGVSKTISYEYNLDGSLKTLHFPSGAAVTYTPDSAGRPIKAVDSNGTNYVSSASYNVPGSLTGLVNGGALTSSFLYNRRLQLCRISAFTTGSAAPACDDSAVHGNLMDRGYNFNFGSSDNGNVISITNYRDASRSQSFTYDALNRLTSGWSVANAGTLSWGENYTLDPWGNLQMNPMQGKAHGGYFPNISDVNNRPLGLGYDAAGNLTNYTAPGQYVYDPENRIQSTGGMTYTYDADGNRVEKSDGSTGTLYWYGTPGIIAESDLSGVLRSQYVFFGGKRIARIDLPANTVHYYLSDHLNSISMVVSAAGAVEEESDYSPFGTEYVVTGSGTNHYKFTGKERDTETGLDYFGARYYSNGLGRFVSADYSSTPVPVPYADFSDPQTLNQYAYVRNLPTVKVDADGHGDAMVKYNQCQASAACRAGDEKDLKEHPFMHVAGPILIMGAEAAIVFAPAIVIDAIKALGSNDDQQQAPQPAQQPAPATPRLPQDQNVNPVPPPANNGNGTVGPNANQNAAAQSDAANAAANGHTDIRTNQQQVDANGNRVGINRPDLQSTDANGVRHYTEYDQSAQSAADHHARTTANDPNGQTHTKIIK